MESPDKDKPLPKLPQINFVFGISTKFTGSSKTSFTNPPFVPQTVSLVVLCYMSFPGDWDGKESACNAENVGSIPGLGRYPGERNGYLFQYSCLAMKWWDWMPWS